MSSDLDYGINVLCGMGCAANEPGLVAISVNCDKIITTSLFTSSQFKLN